MTSKLPTRSVFLYRIIGGAIVLALLCLTALAAGPYQNGNEVREETAKADILREATEPQGSERDSFSEAPDSSLRQETGVDGLRDAPCPVALPADCTSIRVHKGTNVRYWRAISERDCRDVARGLLIELRGGGNELVRADFLDLSSESWGCTVKTQDGEALVISLIPEYLGSPRSERNRLAITVIHIVQPNLEPWEE